MSGKVVEGKYAGANVNKVPDKNLLYIQTENGNKIPLSKSNVISIDDITEQYASNARKTIMVLWDDFETSIIMLGIYEHTSVAPSSKNPINNESSRSQQRDVHQQNNIHNEVSDKSKGAKSRSIFVPVFISAGVTTLILLSAFLISLRIGVLQFSSSKSTLSNSHISSNGIVDSSHQKSEVTIDTIDTSNSAQHVVVTRPSTAATTSTENIADLLNIEMVKMAQALYQC